MNFEFAPIGLQPFCCSPSPWYNGNLCFGEVCFQVVFALGGHYGSEDFSEFLNRIPGSFMFIGGEIEDGSSGMHHSPQFAVDDRAVRPFATVLAASAVDLAQL